MKLLELLGGLLFVAFFPLIQFSCAAQAQTSSESTPTIFIHGIEGARLSDSRGATQWVTLFQALGFSTPNLALPLTWSLEKAGEDVQDRDSLQPSGVLDEVSILPGLVSHKIYSPWLKVASKELAPFYTFAYDWRRDNKESAEKFHAFITEVRGRHGGRKVRVVAHSMGGLISLAVLNDHPEDFEKVVFVGVPFGGGLGFLVDLHEGNVMAFNRRILAPDVMYTFPSVYTLFPEDGRGLVEKNGGPIPMDFYSAEEWKNKKLGIFSENRSFPLIRDSKKSYEFLKKATSVAKEFRKRLVFKSQISYPPLLVILGRHRSTLGTVMQQGPKSVWGWDLETSPGVPGDGRVTATSAVPPKGMAFQEFESQFPHSELLNDPEVFRAIHDFLDKTF